MYMTSGLTYPAYNGMREFVDLDRFQDNREAHLTQTWTHGSVAHLQRAVVTILTWIYIPAIDLKQSKKRIFQEGDHSNHCLF